MAKAKLTIYHPSTEGNGSAIKLELFYQTDDKNGFIHLSFANQIDDKFDFDNGISCDIPVEIVMKIVSFMGGKTKSLTEDNKPVVLSKGVLFAMKDCGDGKFVLASIYKNELETRQSHIELSVCESNGLCTVLEQSLFFLSFIKGVNP